MDETLDFKFDEADSAALNAAATSAQRTLQADRPASEDHSYRPPPVSDSENSSESRASPTGSQGRIWEFAAPRHEESTQQKLEEAGAGGNRMGDSRLPSRSCRPAGICRPRPGPSWPNGKYGPAGSPKQTKAARLRREQKKKELAEQRDSDIKRRCRVSELEALLRERTERIRQLETELEAEREKRRAAELEAARFRAILEDRDLRDGRGQSTGDGAPSDQRH